MPFIYKNRNGDDKVQCSHILARVYKRGERCAFFSSYVDSETGVGYCGKHYAMLNRASTAPAPSKPRAPDQPRLVQLHLLIQSSRSELEEVDRARAAAQAEADEAARKVAALTAKGESLRRFLFQLEEQAAGDYHASPLAQSTRRDQ